MFALPTRQALPTRLLFRALSRPTGLPKQVSCARLYSSSSSSSDNRPRNIASSGGTVAATRRRTGFGGAAVAGLSEEVAAEGGSASGAAFTRLPLVPSTEHLHPSGEFEPNSRGAGVCRYVGLIWGICSWVGRCGSLVILRPT